MKKVIIIGGVAGGASCAARLRRLDESCEIILLERGKYISYANCGLPYHIGNVIKSGRALLLQTPEMMKSRYNVDVRVENEVIAISPEKKVISVLNKKTGENYSEHYDKLVLATGSSPMLLPLPGIDDPKVHTLWTVDDAMAIRKSMKQAKLKTAVVIGGGFIGLEVAENMREEGFHVHVVEAREQVFAPFDEEMALALHSVMEEHGLILHLSKRVTAFENAGDHINVHMSDGEIIPSGLVIVSAGIKPNNELAKSAGLEMNRRGGVAIDEWLRTSDEHIYAVGDLIADETNDDKPIMPLAAPANKQGRIAADNIAGLSVKYDGNRGASIIKMFEYTAAAVGLNEKNLIATGKVKGRDYHSFIITQNDHAGYYPGAESMFLKLIFSADGNQIYGAQILGRNGVDKRIDTIATAMYLGAGVDALERIDFAYSPPFSSAKDPVNMAGFTAKNILAGFVRFGEWNETADENTVWLDIREKAEVHAFPLPDALHIPAGQLREKMVELDKGKRYIIFCTIGVRAYNAARAMAQNGFENVKIYPAGVRFYRRLFGGDSGLDHNSGKYPVSKRINCCGIACPAPSSEIIEAMAEMKAGEILEAAVSSDDALRDAVGCAMNSGDIPLGFQKKNGEVFVYIKKSNENDN